MMEQEDERLRDAFAQLLAMGAKGAVPAEAVWAAQGRSQFPQPATSAARRFPAADSDPANRGLVTPMPEIQTIDPTLELPTAPLPKSSFGEKPFHGKGVVAETTDRPWELPKKKDKKKGKS